MDDDRHRKEEEARREAEERRRDDPLFDYEWQELEEGSTRRASRPESSPVGAERDPERSLGREVDRSQEPGVSQRRGSTRGDRTRGLYGSQIGPNVLHSAVAELVGTFILVFAGTAVAVAGILQRSTVGPLASTTRSPWPWHSGWRSRRSSRRSGTSRGRT